MEPHATYDKAETLSVIVVSDYAAGEDLHLALRAWVDQEGLPAL